MNIAIILFGEFRWFDNFKTTFNKNFKPLLNKHNLYYFSHFWNQDLDNLPKFIEMCNPLIIDIENKKTHQSIQNFFKNKKNLHGSMIYQSYSFYKSFLLLENFQKQNNMIFDMYVKMRVDLAFLNEVNFDNFDFKSIYVKDIAHWRPLDNYVNDYIFFTKNYNVIQKISKIGFYFDDILKNPESFIYEKDILKDIYCPEEILAKYIYDKNISIKTYNFNVDLARHHK